MEDNQSSNGIYIPLFNTKFTKRLPNSKLNGFLWLHQLPHSHLCERDGPSALIETPVRMLSGASGSHIYLKESEESAVAQFLLHRRLDLGQELRKVTRRHHRFHCVAHNTEREKPVDFPRKHTQVAYKSQAPWGVLGIAPSTQKQAWTEWTASVLRNCPPPEVLCPCIGLMCLLWTLPRRVCVMGGSRPALTYKLLRNGKIPEAGGLARLQGEYSDVFHHCPTPGALALSSSGLTWLWR